MLYMGFTQKQLTVAYILQGLHEYNALPFPYNTVNLNVLQIITHTYSCIYSMANCPHLGRSPFLLLQVTIGVGLP